MIASSSNGVISSRFQYCAGASQNSRYDLLDVAPPFAAPAPAFAAGSAPPALGAAPDPGPGPGRRWREAWILARKSPKWSLISCGADAWAAGGCTTADRTTRGPVPADGSRVSGVRAPGRGAGAAMRRARRRALLGGGVEVHVVRGTYGRTRESGQGRLKDIGVDHLVTSEAGNRA